MRLTANELARDAAATGFQAEPLEKVIILLELLEAIRSHPFLKDRVALKGGTALNLFKFDVPRLSIDIDLNYIGSVDREGMVADRPKIEQALHAVCGRVGLQPRRVPSQLRPTLDSNVIIKILLNLSSEVGVVSSRIQKELETYVKAKLAHQPKAV